MFGDRVTGFTAERVERVHFSLYITGILTDTSIVA
jgi:hypothetical protein